MEKKTLFLIISIFIIAVLIAFVVFIFKQKPTEEQEKVIVSTTPSPRIFTGPTYPPLSSLKEGTYEFFSQKDGPKDLGSDLSEKESVLRIFTPIEELKEQFQPVESGDLLTRQFIIPEVQDKNAWRLPDPADISFTNEEYFSLAYPAEYHEYLDTLQDFLVRENYIQAGEKIEIKTEEDSYQILTSFVEFMAGQGFLNKEEKDRFKKGINEELRELNAQERPLVEKQLLGFSWYKFMDQFLAIFIDRIYAQPLCFRQGGGAGIGYNGGSFCCNCGYNIHHGTPYFVPYCAGFVCDINLGCLNAVCPGGAAIWDPMTGICGCG